MCHWGSFVKPRCRINKLISCQIEAWSPPRHSLDTRPLQTKLLWKKVRVLDTAHDETDQKCKMYIDLNDHFLCIATIQTNKTEISPNNNRVFFFRAKFIFEGLCISNWQTSKTAFVKKINICIWNNWIWLTSILLQSLSLDVRSQEMYYFNFFESFPVQWLRTWTSLKSDFSTIVGLWLRLNFTNVTHLNSIQ